MGRNLAKLKQETVSLGAFNVEVCTLSDRQQFSDDDGEAEDLGISSSQWSLFGVVWDSGRALANYLVDINIKDLRILEVGCGIGLASLLLNQRGADITAMDYHPEAGKFLHRNVELNGDAEIRFVHGNWTADIPALKEFDLIVGSDLLYEEEHAQQLADFLERKLAAKGSVIIVDPRRGLRGQFSKRMEANGFLTSHSAVDKLHIMNFHRSS